MLPRRLHTVNKTLLFFTHAFVLRLGKFSGRPLLQVSTLPGSKDKGIGWLSDGSVGSDSGVIGLAIALLGHVTFLARSGISYVFCFFLNYCGVFFYVFEWSLQMWNGYSFS